MNPLRTLMQGLRAADVAAGDFALARGGSKLANLSRAFGPEAKYHDRFPNLTGNTDYRLNKDTSGELLPTLLLAGLGTAVSGGVLAGAAGVKNKMEDFRERLELLMEEQIMEDLWRQGKENGALNPSTGLADPGQPNPHAGRPGFAP